MKARDKRYSNYFWKATAVLFLLFTLHPSLITSSYAEAPKRIISLSPSTTEILFAAGLGDNIVGVTTFCDHPEEAKLKPKIGGMSNPSLEAVITLKPDIVIMTTDGNPKEFEERLRSMNIKTYVFTARTMSQLPDGIRDIGRALNEENSFNTLASDIEKALGSYKARRQGISKKVLFMIWPEPLIVAGPGTAIDDAINLLGAANIADDAVIQYPKYSIEEVVRRSPDIIFVGKGSGMNMEETAGGLLKRISYIPAVKNNKVFYVGDGLYRLGPRVIEGLEELEGLLNKETKD
ncbi:MAG: cobalamin-binding protein [Nitrospirae bacterium]|nr:cobalamin-binding protein [Nitrospirota bacterium]